MLRTGAQPSGIVFRRVSTGRRWSTFAMSMVALATLVKLFAGMAAAHPGLHHDVEGITRILAKNPNRADLLIKRGHLYRLDRKLIESLNDLDRARELDRENREITLERGPTLSALGRDKEAEAELNRFLQTGKATALAYAERGHIRARTGRREIAIADFTLAVRIKPEIDLYLIRGRLQESLDRLDEAASGYRDGLSRLGDATLLKAALIRVETARKRYEVALKLIDSALARASVKTKWHLRRADVLAASRQPAKARFELERALAEANRILAKRPTGMHLFSRAGVYVAMGRLDAAKRDLRLAVRKAPRFAEANELLRKLERGQVSKNE